MRFGGYFSIVHAKKERAAGETAVRFFGQKKSGIELLSHTLMCSTIVAGPLIDRVRDGNVSNKPAIDTGKKREIEDAGWRFGNKDVMKRLRDSRFREFTHA